MFFRIVPTQYMMSFEIDTHHFTLVPSTASRCLYYYFSCFSRMSIRAMRQVGTPPWLQTRPAAVRLWLTPNPNPTVVARLKTCLDGIGYESLIVGDGRRVVDVCHRRDGIGPVWMAGPGHRRQLSGAEMLLVQTEDAHSRCDPGELAEPFPVATPISSLVGPSLLVRRFPDPDRHTL